MKTNWHGPMTTRTVEGAAHWCTYLINGDTSGLSKPEMAECDAWLERELENNEEIIDCGEPYFSWNYGLHTGTMFEGGDLVTYTVLNRDANRVK